MLMSPITITKKLEAKFQIKKKQGMVFTQDGINFVKNIEKFYGLLTAKEKGD